MNIFALDPSPVISARMHCDQHLHKMILESAQMLSTACAEFVPRSFRDSIYRPAYPNHPCTKWIQADLSNAWWVIDLAMELEEIRQELSNCSYHSSSKIIKIFSDCLPPPIVPTPSSFIFAGPALFKLRTDWTIHKQYQEYYKWKARVWALTDSTKMSYKGRPIPAFLKDTNYVNSTNSTNSFSF